MSTVFQYVLLQLVNSFTSICLYNCFECDRYRGLYHNYYYNKLSDVEFSLENLSNNDQNDDGNGITRRNLQTMDIQSSDEYVCNAEDVQQPVTLSFRALLFPVILSLLCTITGR